MQPKTVVCNVCKRELPRHRCEAASLIRPSLAECARKTHPDWNPEGFVCLEDLNKIRTEYVADVLAEGKEEASRLEEDVFASIRKEEILARRLRKQSQLPYTLGQRMADRVARFGGSWTFLGAFALFLALWIAANIAMALFRRGPAFDPYPFILLNLILSCLASIQAPIIMMSQNRQAARDRLDAENDYKVNLKAEIEIRNLHEKMDHLLEHQWKYLLEIQQIQVELMEQIVRKKD